MITTANFIPGDWREKTQLTFVQDFPLKDTAIKTISTSVGNQFYSDLIEFLTEGYGEYMLTHIISAPEP